MGLLDDAIREHLDLKRRRGADPAEVERLEREALGPVRRGPQIAGDPVFDHEDADEADHHTEAWDGLVAEEPVGAEPSGYEALEDDTGPWDLEESSRIEGDEPGRDPLASDAPAAALPDDDVPDWDRDPMAPSRPHAGSATPPPEHPGQETVEYDVESEEPDEHGVSEGDDVLEETPEFLQDTPEHDRLWFEQRPPRDFDFDG